jgi:ABC-type nitrate/sulfonate/bicarbonate transport system substrate-binding protein
MQIRSSARSRLIGVIAVSALLTAACGGGGSGSSDRGDKVVITADPTAIAAFVADQEGFFEGANVEIDTTGHDSAAAGLLAGDTQIAWMGPVEAAQFVSEGNDFKYTSTAGALNMWNAVVVLKENAEEFATIEDLKGQKLGISGFGTGVWAAFNVFSDMFFGIADATTEFENITADSGALLALLEKGEIDAALLHSAEATAARFDDRFTTLFSFTELLQEELGQPLVITGGVATTEWLDAHPDEIAAVTAGLDKAVDWMIANPDAFDEGGKYADMASDAGWNASDTTKQGILDLLTEGRWFLKSDAYTPEWQDAMYSVVEAGEGTLVEKVPAQEDIFYNAD